MPIVHRSIRTIMLHSLLATTGGAGIIVAATPATAQERSVSYSQGTMILPRALQRIGGAFGVEVDYDPAEIENVSARPVRNAANALDAVRQAAMITGITVTQNANGGIVVRRAPDSTDDIVVTAKRDEAETNLNVNSAATSTRTGKSLREQPRSTAVVGAKLIADQQVQSVQEALRNVSGVAATAGTQGLPNFTVRGFDSGALTNGLVGSPGGVQPVAGLERVEVLKGPDAVLAGANNLGGIVNIVTKRPTAQPLLNLTLEYGTFNDRKVVVDASNALNLDRTFSARLVAEAAKADRNYQGYNGREEYLFASSFRYKTATSDFVVGLSTSDVFTPINASTLIDRNFTDRNVLYPQLRVPFAARDQGVRLSVTREYFDFSQKVSDWLTLVARGEHAVSNRTIRVFLPYGPFTPSFETAPATDNTEVYGSNVTGLRTPSNAFDGYARLNFATGPVKHTVSIGANYSRRVATTLYDAGEPAFYQVNVLTGAASSFFEPNGPITDIPPLGYPSVKQFTTTDRQTGFYAQDFAEFGPLKVVAALRVNRYRNAIAYGVPELVQYDISQMFSSTLPSFGVVYDITPNVSVYANYQRGYQPGGANADFASTVAGAFTGLVLPDIKSRNVEGGVKVDLFNRNLSIVASYYENRQSNVPDSQTIPGTTFLLAGQRSRGFELDVNGRILPGWNVSATFSRANFVYLEPTDFFQVVLGQPKTRYSFFTSYEPTSGALKGFGASAGLYGNSSSFAYGGAIGPAVGAFDNGATPPVFASFRPFVPESRQFDANLYVKLGGARLNLGVKNLFDRRNYSQAPTYDFIPLAEPRTFRATLSYNFY